MPGGTCQYSPVRGRISYRLLIFARTDETLSREEPHAFSRKYVLSTKPVLSRRIRGRFSVRRVPIYCKPVFFSKRTNCYHVIAINYTLLSPIIIITVPFHVRKHSLIRVETYVFRYGSNNTNHFERASRVCAAHAYTNRRKPFVQRLSNYFSVLTAEHLTSSSSSVTPDGESVTSTSVWRRNNRQGRVLCGSALGYYPRTFSATAFGNAGNNCRLISAVRYGRALGLYRGRGNGCITIPWDAVTGGPGNENKIEKYPTLAAKVALCAQPTPSFTVRRRKRRVHRYTCLSGDWRGPCRELLPKLPYASVQ